MMAFRVDRFWVFVGQFEMEGGLQHTAENKEKIQAKADRAVEMSKGDRDEILRVITNSVDALDTREERLASNTMAKFAILLVNLANQADRQSEINEKLTKKVVWMTWVLVWLTAVLTIIGILQIAFMADQYFNTPEKNVNAQTDLHAVADDQKQK